MSTKRRSIILPLLGSIILMGAASGQSPTPVSVPAGPPIAPAVAAAPVSPAPAAGAVAPSVPAVPVGQSPAPSATQVPVPASAPAVIPVAPAVPTPVPAMSANDSSSGILFAAPKPAAPPIAPVATPIPSSISSQVSVPLSTKQNIAPDAVVQPVPGQLSQGQSGHVGQFEASPLQDDWLIASDQENRQTAKGYTVSTTTHQSDPSLQNGSTTEQIQSEYSRFIGNWGKIQVDSNVQQPDFSGSYGGAQGFQEEQRLTVSETPGDNLSGGQELHHIEVISNDGLDNSETYGGGWNANLNHVAPLNTDVKFDSQIDFQQVAGADAQQINSTGLELRQPILNNSLTAVVSGKYTDSKDPSQHDFLQSQAPTLEQALEWSTHPETKLRFGLREQEYANLESVTAQKTQGVFAHFSQIVLPDVVLNTDVEYQRSRQDSLLEETPSGASPTSLAGSVVAPNETVTGFQDESMLLKFGPSFKIQQDLSANMEFSNKWDRSITPGTPSSEQRVSLSLKGTF